MCHLVLALPLLALPVFWLLPLGAAILLYGATLAVAAGVYVNECVMPPSALPLEA